MASASFVLTSCSRDFTETKFFQEELETSIATAEDLNTFLQGTYAKMRSTSYLGSLYRGYAQIHTDETYCTQYSGRNVQFATYRLTSLSGDPADTWYAIYQTIANANIVINASDDLTLNGVRGAAATQRVKNIKAQAYAIRALAFFDLLKLYGQQYSGGNLGVVLPTKFNSDAKMPRATVAETKAQIEADFAKALLDIGTTNNGVVNLNANSIKALMSRYYLFAGDYAKVRQYADEVINSGAYSVISAGDYVDSFSKSGVENSIFELAVGLNGALGTTSYDYIMNHGGYANVAVLQDAVSMYNATDVRRNVIVQDDEYYLSGKFSDLRGATNIKLVRYEEVLLNAAEAHLMPGGDTAKALAYYNQILTNRGLAAATSVTLDDIKKERSKELIGEGFRFWDLLRWGSTIPYHTNAGVRDNTKDKTIGDNLLAFPIPQTETNVSGTPVKSNPGYDN